MVLLMSYKRTFASSNVSERAQMLEVIVLFCLIFKHLFLPETFKVANMLLEGRHSSFWWWESDRERRGGWHLVKVTYRIWTHVIMLCTFARVPPKPNWVLVVSDWLTSPLKVTGRLMSWSLTEEMCLTLRPSCLPPPVMIIIFSYLHSRRLSHSRLFTISLEDIPAFHPPPHLPIFLSALLSLILSWGKTSLF